VGRRVQALALEIAVTVASTWLLALACSTLGDSGGSGDSDSKPDTDPGGCLDCEGDPPLGFGGGFVAETDAGLDAETDAPALEDAGDADVEVPPVCVPETDAGPVPLLRPGCPPEKPVASRCAPEGLRCLYESEAEECFEEWTCLFGLWSPLEQACRGAGGVSDNGGECPSFAPVEGEPCETEGLECGFEQCWNDEPTWRAVCDCGRFRLEQLGCPSPGAK
jgi:hypothetical protein